MPASIDPEPAENEFECANCGAYFHYELTRCPSCGVNLYEPEDDPEGRRNPPVVTSLFGKLTDVFHRIFNKPYVADDVFGDALDASILYNNFLQKVGGDRAVADRLIEMEKAALPAATRRACIQSALQHWERDNRADKNFD